MPKSPEEEYVDLMFNAAEAGARAAETRRKMKKDYPKTVERIDKKKKERRRELGLDD